MIECLELNRHTNVSYTFGCADPCSHFSNKNGQIQEMELRCRPRVRLKATPRHPVECSHCRFDIHRHGNEKSHGNKSLKRGSLNNIRASTEFLRTTRLLMRVPRNDFSDVVIAHRKVQTSAGFQLPNLLPVKLLPRGVVVDLKRSKISSAFRDLVIAQ